MTSVKQYPTVGITHAGMWASKDGFRWEHCPSGEVTLSPGGYITGWTITSPLDAREVMTDCVFARTRAAKFPRVGITGPGRWLALAWPEYRQVSSEELDALIESGAKVRAWFVHTPADAHEFMWSDFDRAMKGGAP